VESAQGAERGSFGGSKAPQRGVWQAVDHLTGVVLAYGMGSRADEGFVRSQALRKPFRVARFYTAAAEVDERHLPAPIHPVGKVHTQQIEGNHLTLRPRLKRLARQALCVSKAGLMHDTVSGFFVTRYGLGNSV
jgi:insertion element IS1 protein InsB